MVWYMEGDKSRGVCHRCRKVVATTFKYADLRLKGGRRVVHEVLQDFCDVCGEAVSLPPQSTPKVRELREAEDRAAVELRMPLEMGDLMDWLSLNYSLPANRNEVCRTLADFFLRRYDFASTPFARRRLHGALEDRFATGRNRMRVSFRWNRTRENQVRRIASACGVRKSDVFRAFLVLARRELAEQTNTPAARQLREQAANRA